MLCVCAGTVRMPRSYQLLRDRQAMHRPLLARRMGYAVPIVVRRCNRALPRGRYVPRGESGGEGLERRAAGAAPAPRAVGVSTKSRGSQLNWSSFFITTSPLCKDVRRRLKTPKLHSGRVCMQVSDGWAFARDRQNQSRVGQKHSAEENRKAAKESRPKRPRKEKRREREGEGGGVSVPLLTQAEASSVSDDGPKQSAAAGGGVWVHVPA